MTTNQFWNMQTIQHTYVHPPESVLPSVPASGSVYPAQDSMLLGEHYMRHVSAMTSESLHSKADIARQLAARDEMLALLWNEYEDRRAQWGNEYLWGKHEDTLTIKKVEAFIKQTQNTKLTSP